MGVVHRGHRPVIQGREPLGEFDGNRRDLGPGLPGDPRLDHLGVKPVRLHLGDAAQAVADGSERAFDGRVFEPALQLGLDERHDGHLVLPHPVLRSRQRRANRLADDHQQLHRHAGLGAQLLECHAAERGKAIKARTVEEGERDTPLSHVRGQAVEREPCSDEALDQPDPTHVAR